MGKRELVALLNLSSWCLVMVERLFLSVPWGCLRFVIVVFPDHNPLLFMNPKELVWDILSDVFKLGTSGIKTIVNFARLYCMSGTGFHVLNACTQ